MSYHQKADFVCSSVVMTSQRANIMDVPYIFLVSPFALMIPMPRPSTDAGGFWKPFQPNVIYYTSINNYWWVFKSFIQVWLASFISLLIIVFWFWLAMTFLSKVNVQSLGRIYNTMHEMYRRPYFMAKYTISVLLSQRITIYIITFIIIYINMYLYQRVFSTIMEMLFELE